MEKTAKLLVIDDDRELNELLAEYLGGFGYTVKGALHPLDGLKNLRLEGADLVILDIMLPEMDGFEVCRTIRKESQVPIIMLSARGDTMDKIVGLEVGADDYLAKPFEPRELLARVQAILRRSNGSSPSSDSIEFKHLKLEVSTQKVLVRGEALELTTAEFQILELLCRNHGKILDRDQMMQSLNGFEWEVTNRSIDVAVSRLRQKLGEDPKKPEFIKTIRGRGYQCIAE